LKRGEAIGAKAALDPVRVERPFDFAKVNRNFTLVASQTDVAEEITELRAALDRDGVIYEGYTRVRPTVPAARPTFFSRLV